MDFTIPVDTENFTVYPGDVITTTLSLALWLVDDFTKERPVGAISVKIKNTDLKAFQNQSGYFLLTDLPLGNHSIIIESYFFFTEEITVDTAALDPKKPVKEIILKPKPSYPFPGNATLVRGVVKTGAVPVADAVVKVPSKSIETRTDESGEFALCFKGVKQASIGAEIKKGGDTKAVNISVEEGKTVSVGVIPFP